MNLFYTWGSILGPVIAGAVYDRTHSYATVMTGMTVLLIIATLFTATLINPWAATQGRLREVAVTAAT
jgi:predicted MFS family arabinose efflux permease